VGLVSSVIELWDLDVLDPVEPMTTLPVFHKESITSLALNKNLVQVLASSSADKTVAIWNLDENKIVQHWTTNSHANQVQFHPTKLNLLSVACENSELSIIDCKSEKIVRTIDSTQFNSETCKVDKAKLVSITNSEWNENNCFMGYNNGTLIELDCFNSKLVRSCELLGQRSKTRGNDLVFIECWS